MKNSPLSRLGTLGQSVWLDYIRRDLMTGGGLRRLIEEDGLRGMTSNPSIFEKSIAGSHEYDGDITAMGQAGKDANAIYEALTQRDVKSAADEFRSVYYKTEGTDGFVSLEVNPHLARDTQGTIQEARRLWAALDRPNVLIKIPGTAEGLPAIRQLISEGINVNVTLLFGLPRYRQVAEAYIAGIEERAAGKKPVEHVASVASFFLSRIDVLVDPMLDARSAQDGNEADFAKKALGQTAIASAKIAYHIYKEIFGSDRFMKLSALGARPQRLLWASTGNENPEYSDVKYIEELIGLHTISTVPIKTLDAYRDHGNPKLRLVQNGDGARLVLGTLTQAGIDLDDVTTCLESEGVEQFTRQYDLLLESIAHKAPNATAGETQ